MMSLKQRARAYSAQHGCGYQKALSIVRDPVIFPMDRFTIAGERVAVELNPDNPHLLLSGADAQEVLEATLHDDLALNGVDPLRDLRPVEWLPSEVIRHVRHVDMRMLRVSGKLPESLAELRVAERAAGVETTPYLRYFVPELRALPADELHVLHEVIGSGHHRGVQVLIGAVTVTPEEHIVARVGRTLFTALIQKGGYPGGTPRADFEVMKRDVAEAQRVPGVTLA